MTAKAAFERHVMTALNGTPRRIPVVTGGCGSGRTTLLGVLARQLGSRACQYIDVERAATTPERFYRGLISTSPFRLGDAAANINTPREAFQAIVAYLTQARTDSGGPATFLLDEALEFRTFESFPGLRNVVSDLLAALGSSQNQFVLTTRYAHRALKLLRDPEKYSLLPVPPLTETEVREAYGGTANGHSPSSLEETARIVLLLADGRPAYVHDIWEQMAVLAHDGGADPVSALTALLARQGRMSARCRFCYELRLHRARGYGALKAILDILAHENSLTLTEIAQRLHRTPGSTKDYLSWLEDVDLVVTNRKRYSFSDPVLRLWVRLHCRPVPPHDEEVAREVQRYVLERFAASTAVA